MKKKHWLYLLSFVACLVVFFAYQALDRLRNDVTAPEITVSETLLEISVEDPEDMLLEGIRAQDNADGDVTDSIVVETIRLLDSDGRASVRYAAFDRAGNVAQADREIRFVDYLAPRFSLTAPLLFVQNTNMAVLNLVGATDLFDGDIAHRIHATSLDENSISALGIHDVEFRVTNSLGDTAKVVLPVEVYASGTYVGKLELSDYLVYLEKDASFDAQSYLVSYTLSNTVTSLEDDLPDGYMLEIIGHVDTAVPGTYTLAYKLTYQGSNQSYTGYTKLIVIVEG